MLHKTLLYITFSFALVFSSCSTSSRNYSSTKSHSKSKKYKKARSSKSETYSHSNHSSSTKARKLVQTRTGISHSASKFKGAPYVYGGKKPNGFDCSGFITYVYNNQGIDVFGNSRSLATQGRRINLKQAKKGDLLFFGNNGKVSHVAIIISQSSGVLEVIHATSSRGVVQENIAGSKYWTPKIMFVRDVLTQEVLAD